MADKIVGLLLATKDVALFGNLSLLLTIGDRRPRFRIVADVILYTALVLGVWFELDSVHNQNQGNVLFTLVFGPGGTPIMRSKIELIWVTFSKETSDSQIRTKFSYEIPLLYFIISTYVIAISEAPWCKLQEFTRGKLCDNFVETITCKVHL